jgi:hypothetical protein
MDTSMGNALSHQTGRESMQILQEVFTVYLEHSKKIDILQAQKWLASSETIDPIIDPIIDQIIEQREEQYHLLTFQGLELPKLLQTAIVG